MSDGIYINPIRKHQPPEGRHLNVTCSGNSYPAMTDNDVSWTKHNNDSFKHNGRYLVIDNVNRINSGTYVCSVIIILTPTFGHPINVTGTTTAEVDVICKYSCGKVCRFAVFISIKLRYYMYEWCLHVNTQTAFEVVKILNQSLTLILDVICEN